jgi:ABC-type polysaccharide/polyol phosphate transport system ATPase subunit
VATTTPPKIAAALMPSEPRPAPAIEISEVRKAFRLPHQRYHTLKERALHPFRSNRYDVLHAVDDVTVAIAQGEFFGIVGRNGSGKSTLLKCLAGIYRIDNGALTVYGRLSPFIELGVGFNMDLTARDNVMINAIMLGLTRKQARERFDHIISFAELEGFLDLKLKNYSSGMLVRLAFSVAIQVDADILLIDEVLAVGDAAFQQKCYDEFERLKKSGRTIVFVTHDMSAVERFCDRAMLLDHGRMIEIGEPAAVARSYREINFGRLVHESTDGELAHLPVSGSPAEIVDAWFEDADGERIATIAHGDLCAACVEVRFSEAQTNPIFGVTLRNDTGSTVFATSTAFSQVETGEFGPGQTAVIRLRFDNWLTASRYSLTPSVARSGTGEDVLAVQEDMAQLLVHGWYFTGGVTNLPHSFEVIRG